jgi:hypothetical protein
MGKGFPGSKKPISEPGNHVQYANLFRDRDSFGSQRERQSIVYLGFSFCLHSDAISQGFDELVKLDPRSGGFLVMVTSTALAQDLECC